MKRNLISCLTKPGIGTSASVCIDRFGIVTQEDTKQNETEAYPNKNLADFKKNWNRTARGNRAECRGSDIKSTSIRSYERLRYRQT